MKLWPFSKKEKTGGASSASALPPGVVLAAPEEAEQDPLSAPNVASHNDPVLSDPAPTPETPPPAPAPDASEVYLFGDPAETGSSLPQAEAGLPEAFSMENLPPQADTFPSAESLMPPLTPAPMESVGTPADSLEAGTPSAAPALPEWMSYMTGSSADNAPELADTLDLLTPPATAQVNVPGFAAAWADAEPLANTATFNESDSSEMPSADFFATSPEFLPPAGELPLSPPAESFSPPSGMPLSPADETNDLEADPMSWLDNPAERGGHTQVEVVDHSDLLADLGPQTSEQQPAEAFSVFEAADTSADSPAAFPEYETPEDTFTEAEADFNSGVYELSAEPAASANATDLYGLGSLTEPLPTSSYLSFDTDEPARSSEDLYLSAPPHPTTDSAAAEEMSAWSESPLYAASDPLAESATFEILPDPDDDEVAPDNYMQTADTFHAASEAAPETAMDPVTAMCFDTGHSLEAMAPPSVDEAQAFADGAEDSMMTLEAPAEDEEESFLFSPEFDPQNESLLADLPADNEEDAEAAEERFYSQEDLDLADPPADLHSYDLGHYDDPNDLHDVINLDEAAPAEAHFLSEHEHEPVSRLEKASEESAYAEEDPFYNFYDPAPEAPAVAEPTLSGVEPTETTAFATPEGDQWDLEPPEVPSTHNEPMFDELTSAQETNTPAAEPARIIPLQPLLPEATPPAMQTAYPQSTFDFKPKAAQQRSMVEALDDFEQQILLEDSRFMKKSIDDLVSRYFAQKDREEKAW